MTGLSTKCYCSIVYYEENAIIARVLDRADRLPVELSQIVYRMSVASSAVGPVVATVILVRLYR